MTPSFRQQIGVLKDLQKIDLQIHRLKHQIENFPEESAKREKVLGETRQNAQSSKVRLDEIEGKYLTVDEEIQKLEKRAKIAQEKMEKGDAGAKAAKKDLRQIKGTQENLVNRRKKLEKEMQIAKEMFEEVTEKLEKLEDLVKNAPVPDPDLINGEIANLKENREQYRPQIEPAVLKKYEFVSSRRSGKALSPTTNGSCGVCNVQIPHKMFSSIVKSEELITCPSCDRILYYSPE